METVQQIEKIREIYRIVSKTVLYPCQCVSNIILGHLGDTVTKFVQIYWIFHRYPICPGINRIKILKFPYKIEGAVKKYINKQWLVFRPRPIQVVKKGPRKSRATVPLICHLEKTSMGEATQKKYSAYSDTYTYSNKKSLGEFSSSHLAEPKMIRICQAEDDQYCAFLI